MIWINYLIRLPFGAVIATIILIMASVAMVFCAVCINWEEQIGEFRTLPKEWLDCVKEIGGIG